MARRLGVDPKTVQRWIDGRLPYPRHRRSIAEMLSVEEALIWPNLAPRNSAPEPPPVAVLGTYPHRWAVPRAVWLRHFESARREIDILAYASLFLAEDSGIIRALVKRAHAGVSVRLLLGDPDGAHIRERGNDERVGDSLSAKIRNALVLYEPLREAPNFEIRLHDTVLYNSIYRADDDVLVNHHAYGVAASDAPVLHARHTTDGDMASTYLASLTHVWDSATAI
ncbi:phospholipase D-like domain-containing protein [Actinomadura harenae]|uniref:XRE family transcriptional regulator n=1 Tax=Actinomadura harenae TaxID=2483351 RepID=UPI001F339ED8|nr:XRE family transcriptional regulator [Actinomadura harenae]